MAEKNPLFEFYKELYFHEIDVREYLSARVQIPLAITVSLAGTFGFMILKFDEKINGIYSYVFVGVLVLGGIMLIFSAYYLVRSWMGHEYSFLPSAGDTEKYRIKLIDTYREYDNQNDLVQGYLDDYICSYYINCSTKNTDCNDKRSLYLHKANTTIIGGIFFAVLSFLVFYLGGFDGTQSSQPIKINIVNPVEIRELDMSDKEEEKSPPPPPPPPPPERLIREGVKIIPPKGTENGRR